MKKLPKMTIVIYASVVIHSLVSILKHSFLNRRINIKKNQLHEKIIKFQIIQPDGKIYFEDIF